MLTAIPDGGTVLRLGPNGLDLEPLGLHDAGPMLEQYLSWPALEAALRDAGPLTIEISDDARWSDVEKMTFPLGMAGRSDVPVLANTSMGFSFDLESSTPVIIDATAVRFCFGHHHGRCSALWRRGDPPRAVAVDLEGQSIAPSVEVFEHVDLAARKKFDRPTGLECRHSGLRFKEVVREVEAIRCSSCRMGVKRGRTAKEFEEYQRTMKDLQRIFGPKRDTSRKP